MNGAHVGIMRKCVKWGWRVFETTPPSRNSSDASEMRSLGISGESFPDHHLVLQNATTSVLPLSDEVP